MHTATSPAGDAANATGRQTTRVAVAGATGFTGQELLRLLARHPAVTLTLATSSGAASTARRLPALGHTGAVRSRRSTSDALTREADLIFLALPDSTAAELAPALVEAGRPRDRSVWCVSSDAIKRHVSAGTRRPGTLPSGIAYGLTEHERDSVRSARLVANPGCYPTTALMPLKPLARCRSSRSRRGRHRRREVGRVRRRQDAVGAHALFRVSRQHVGVRRLRTPPRGGNRDRALARRSRSRRTWRRSTAASWPPFTSACRQAHPKTNWPPVYRSRLQERPFIRLARLGAAGDQARRPHQLLRHRMARRSRQAA